MECLNLIGETLRSFLFPSCQLQEEGAEASVSSEYLPSDGLTQVPGVVVTKLVGSLISQYFRFRPLNIGALTQFK